MKRCELCGAAARMYCESDQASLCWDCDEKVHRANFLVAKHYRSLLCQVCQSPTPWKASGPKLGPTVSICDSCFDLHNNQNKGEICDDPEESHAGNEFLDGDGDEEDYSDDEEEEEEEEEEEDDEEEEEEEDGENQVVPWSVTSPSPPVASSSSSEDSSRFYGASAAALKRMPENHADHDSDDEIGCSSSHTGSARLNNDEGNSISSLLRPSKRARRDGEVDDNHNHSQFESRKSTAIIDTLKRLQSEIVSNEQSASATILGICRLSSSDNRSR